MPDPVTTVTAITTAVKNAVDVTNSMIGNRKQNKLVTKAQLQRLQTYVDRIIQEERMSAIHQLSMSAANKLEESYQKVAEHANSPLGIFLMETFKHEAYAYQRIIDDFYNLPSKVSGCR